MVKILIFIFALNAYAQESDTSAIAQMDSSDLVIISAEAKQPMELEDNLAVKKVYMLLTDNTDGIYSRLLLGYYKKYIKKRFVDLKSFLAKLLLKILIYFQMNLIKK